MEYGYTLWASALMAHLGTKVAGALAAVIGTWYTTRLLHRLRPSRAVLGGVAAAVTQVGNVVEGRITFACGLTCGLIAITVFTTTRLPRWLASAWPRCSACSAAAPARSPRCCCGWPAWWR